MATDSGDDRNQLHGIVDDLKSKLDELTGALTRLEGVPSGAPSKQSRREIQTETSPSNFCFPWMKDAALPRAPRRSRPSGTSLFPDKRTGNFIWTRWDDKSGRKLSRSTRTTDYTIAIQISARYEHEYQRRRAGLAVYDVYANPLGPAADHWIASLTVGDITRHSLKLQIHRALRLLKLRTFADLDDIQRLERNLLALEGTKGHRGPFTRLTLRVSFQKVLKQFSGWCSRNRRYLPNDPLAQWEFLTVPDSLPRRRRRALSPPEMARSLLAADALDRLYKRQHSTSIVWLGLLVTGSRLGAFADADVPKLDRDRGRIDLGPGVGKKRRGTAALDPKTLTEVLAYVGDRTEGPLFLSPRAGRLERSNAIDDWRQAVTLAIVDELWPADMARDLDTLVLVTNALMKDRVGNPGGSPLQLREETKRAREDREREIRGIAAGLAEVWEARMQGVDLHALRKTHRTWAEAAGVNPILIDKQLGHSTAAGSAALDMTRSLLTSATGRKHYVDMGLEIIDPRQAAEAVRKLLDGAREEILTQGRTVFAPNGEVSLPPVLKLDVVASG
jgi:hypothetical protein